MARKKISTTIYITPEQSERLKQLHDKTKVPVAEYIRQGIDMLLDRERRHLPGQLTFEVGRDAPRRGDLGDGDDVDQRG
jgi:Ribbon-helix-helix domain